MSDHPLPWHVLAPYEHHGEMKNHSVWDAEGELIAECYGQDRGREEALAIVSAVNRAGPRLCSNCGETATCFGAYEDGLHPGYSCDVCCGHGNEDGHCDPVEKAP